MATRAERADERARRKSERLAEQEAEYERNRLEIQRRNRAQGAEESGYGLESPGIDPTTGAAAIDVAGEYRSAIYWAKLLGIKPEREKLTCLCARIYQRFMEERAPLWNPFSQKWSSNWRMVVKGRGFKSNWKVVEGSDSFMVDPRDFEEAPASEAPAQAAPIPEKKTVEVNIPLNPWPTYSARSGALED
jgi:hypothetical protein